ncbi:hypothetical protein SELMODRAFT_102594 [Selaginella moellendorffii]|uniref:Ribosomal protein L13a n=1 Tax=Selaginella moellendorffii TaxID=88036 RepID=D8RVH3_SELML|nr:hypothetical protein SELMODRAFT_102594 [Selaginella moellendorffii]
MEIVIDGHGHILGRVASICSKELLKGQRLVIVRCEDICMSGGIIRQKMKYHRALRRRSNTNPRRGGPKIETSPSGILARVIKGMLPRSKRAGALRNFKAYDGCPPPYGVVKKMVIPDALKVLRMRRESPFCLLGALARDLGWEGGDFVAKLEAKRKEKALVFYKRKLKFLAERSRILDEYDKKQNELQQQQENLLEGIVVALVFYKIKCKVCSRDR